MKKEIPSRRNGWYYINGEKYISVTKVLNETLNKPALIYWAAQQASRIALDDPTLNEKEVIGKVFSKRDKAGERGKTIHSLSDEFAKGSPIEIEDVPEKYRGYAKALKSCLAEIKPEILKTEQKVYSELYKYAGTLDGIWKVNGEIYIIDYKTSGYYPEHDLQLVAYKTAALEMKLINHIDKTKIILLKENATYDLIETDAPIGIFLNTLAIWRYKNDK